MKTEKKPYIATRNPCKLCAPLGASLVFQGISGALTFLHGSQGCSTYIRRYFINHFREPLDIAASNFSEETAIFGGRDNLLTGLKNVCKQYGPKLIGVATTCLSETIGDDVPAILREFHLKQPSDFVPKIVYVSTPSYAGTHIDGFHAAVGAVVSTLASKRDRLRQIGIFPGLVSPADIRYLKEVMSDFGLDSVILPDYSETLDGGMWTEYQKIQRGGTSLREIASLGGSLGIIEFGHSLKEKETAGTFLKERFSVERFSLELPVGIRLTDLFFELLEKLSGRKTQDKYRLRRSRLVDSYVDGHKYMFEKKAVVYGDEDMVASIASFLLEIGVIPVLCATGAHSGTFEPVLNEIASRYGREITVCEGLDFEEISEKCKGLNIDFMVGGSKGYYIARKMSVPLVRIGFPIHDRIGAQRILHLGYEGTQQLFDRIVNAIIEKEQGASPVGYSYM
ncbi:MAG: nitrogenase [Candidatus Omnitrophica bacterium]|nr:nitrogenase [Candidatus Omnitrophota bacterium]